MKSKDLDKNVTVKLAKSATKKYKDDGSTYVTPTRYREVKFPTNWIDIKYQNDMKFYVEDIENNKLKKRVLDYLLKYHNCNTHSLRYAYINYMLYVKKKEMGLVAKIIGHSNLNQLVRYTQNKNAKEVFDMEI
jgi:cobalamin biosynthesis Co2+ chelatase CbiK